MNEKLAQAVKLVKEGQKKQGGLMLQEIVREQPQNELAWLWLANCVSDDQQKIACYSKAAEINPQNENTIKALQRLQQDELNPFQFTNVTIKPKTTNTLSVFSFIAAILGWFFMFGFDYVVRIKDTLTRDVFGVASLLFILSAIVTGIIGLIQTKKKFQKGKGWAIAGIIISGAFVLYFFLYL